jgi:catalase
LVHAFKPDPVTNRQDGERIFDFISNTPEAMHMITFLFSPWASPPTTGRCRARASTPTSGSTPRARAVLVKYHWEPKAGIKNLTQPEAEQIQAKNFNHATQDLFDAIERGDYPEWELLVQIMSDDEHPELDFDPLDDTKLWPPEQFPWLPWAAWC